MRKNRIFSRSGETLVEAIVSIAIFLMMMAILQGAISFCTNAQRKSEQIRKMNAEISKNLPAASYTAGGTVAKYEFKAVSADGTQTGMNVLFQVDVDLGTKAVHYEDEEGRDQTATFYLFGSASAAPVDPPAGGEADP